MNEHIDRTEATDPNEERELRAVVSLLRGLPDPEPPEALRERVMAEVRRRESGPRVLRVAFRRMEPLIATGLAAGIGALLLATAIQSGLSPLGESAPGGLEPSEARRVTSARIASVAASEPTPIPIRVALPGAERHSAHLLGMSPQSLLGESHGRSATNPLDLGLDHQLNRLLLDPEDFYARIQRMEQPDRFVARLADRAARRGDAAEIALHLRQRSPQHPHNAMMVDRLLRASLALQVPRP